MIWYLVDRLNYRKGGKEVRDQYFLWKKLCSHEISQQCVPFVAGWNAAVEWITKNGLPIRDIGADNQK